MRTSLQACISSSKRLSPLKTSIGVIISALFSMYGFPAHNTLVFRKVLCFCYKIAGIVGKIVRFPKKYVEKIRKSQEEFCSFYCVPRYSNPKEYPLKYSFGLEPLPGISLLPYPTSHFPICVDPSVFDLKQKLVHSL